MTTFKTVLWHSSYLLGSRLLARLIYIVFFIYAALRLGPELLGVLSLNLWLATAAGIGGHGVTILLSGGVRLSELRSLMGS